MNTSFFVYFGGDRSTSDYIGKGVIDTGCSRFLIGQNTLEKWEQMLTRRWGLSTQRIQLAKAMTFRFGNDETLETRPLAVLPVGMAGVNGLLRVYVVAGGAPLLLSKGFLRDLGCHIDLGRGHLFFEKLGVRAVVTSEQSPHLLLPLTSFGPQGHKIPAEIQPRISSDECAIYRAACDSSRQNKIHLWIASASDHRAPEADSTYTESLRGTDGQEKNPCDEARDYWENREGRWVRVHSIARRTLFDPMHDEQPFCQNLTERRKTTVRFLVQQSEMTIDDTWPQAGEMRSLWKGTTEFWTNDMPQDDTWEANRHHSHMLPALSQSFDSTRSCHASFTCKPCCPG